MAFSLISETDQDVGFWNCSYIFSPSGKLSLYVMCVMCVNLYVMCVSQITVQNFFHFVMHIIDAK